MKNRTVTITVSASVDEVFSFLANPETLPLWAVSFCKAIRQNEGRWVVSTGQGELAFAIESDRSSGCIEMLAGPTVETMESFPIRVYRADNGQTVASFTMFKSQRPGMTDASFEVQYRILVKEVGTLVDRFGGGELSSGLSEGNRCYAGIVSDDIAASREFYTRHFGYEVIFDAPFYLHLKRDSGEQLGLLAPSDDAGHSELSVATKGAGTWLSIEVDDVDAEYARLESEGLVFREVPTDQPWGERTCVVCDPNGVLNYLSEVTGKMDESMKRFVREAGAELVG